jgi:FdhE protein
MQRILEPGQIESFAQRTLPRLRLPDRQRVFSTRAARLRQQSENGAVGHAIGDYLRLMAHLADAQQAALMTFEPTTLTSQQIANAREFRMPLIASIGWRRAEHWRQVLISLCDSIATMSDVAEQVWAVCDRLRTLAPDQLELQADALLASQTEAVDIASAPFVMGALQVYWVDLASRLPIDDVHELDVPGVCPICGTLPVASVVRYISTKPPRRAVMCARSCLVLRNRVTDLKTTSSLLGHGILSR